MKSQKIIRPADGLISEREAASYLGVVPRTLINWRRDGIVPWYKIGRRVLYRRSEIDRVIQERFHRGATI